MFSLTSNPGHECHLYLKAALLTILNATKTPCIPEMSKKVDSWHFLRWKPGRFFAWSSFSTPKMSQNIENSYQIRNMPLLVTAVTLTDVISSFPNIICHKIRINLSIQLNFPNNASNKCPFVPCHFDICHFPDRHPLYRLSYTPIMKCIKKTE